MKKIFFVILCALMAIEFSQNNAKAETISLGTPAKTWTYPEIYAMDEDVTWYFDVTDVGFEEGVDLYMWAWEPTEPDKNNWENSSDFAKLTYAGDGVYYININPLKYYQQAKPELTVADMEACPGFWMKLKTKDGGYETGAFSVPWSIAQVKDFLESGEAVKAFPDRFKLREPLSIVVNIAAFTFNGKVGGLKDIAWESIHMHSGLDNWSVLQEANMSQPDAVEKTKFKHLGGDLYKIDLIPMDYYGTESDYEPENLTWLTTTHNPDWAATGDGPTLKAAVTVAYPDPEFTIFPQKVSAIDILTLTRLWNEKTSGELKYTITAGEKTITGVMKGERDKRQASVCLLNELNGMSGVKQITVRIDNKSGVKLLETVIPLIPTSDVTFE